MTRAQSVELPADALTGDAVVALYFSDQRPLDGPAALLDWRLDGQLTRLLLDGSARGRAGEHVLLQGNGKLKTPWVLFVGGGKWQGLSLETHASLVRHMLVAALKAGCRDLSLAFMPHAEITCADIVQQVDNALAGCGDDIVACRVACAESVSAW